jgi:phenol hydroxylase P4 protein
MPVASTYDYRGEVRDAAGNFHGNQVTYVHWKRHLMFCAPLAFPFPPDMPFGAIVEAVLPGIYGAHPDWAKIDWPSVAWTLDGAPFVPDFAAGLAANGLGHKSLLTFSTPGLDGMGGTST